MASPETEGITHRQSVAGSMDAHAFAGVVETYQVTVFNLCYRMLGDALRRTRRGEGGAHP